MTELANINMETVNKNDLVDITDIPFDNAIPQEQRAAWIVKMVKNPYCFRVGEIGIKLEFTSNAPSLQDRLTALLLRKKSGF